MSRSTSILVSLIVWLAGSAVGHAQVIPGMTYSGAFEGYYQAWDLTNGDETTKVNQLITPISIFLPFTDRMDVRLGTSYASFGRETDDGRSVGVNGITDLRLNFNYALLNRRLLIGLIANLPTGQGQLTSVEQDIVFDFVSPDMSVRANRLGEGFNIGGTVTYGAPVSHSTLISLGAGVIGRGAYDTALPTSEEMFNLSPGILANGSIGLDVFTGPNHVHLGSQLSYYGTERVDDVDHYRIGPEIALDANYGLAYSQSKGFFSAGLRQIIRLDNSVQTGSGFGKEPVSLNGSYLAISLANDYSVSRSVLLNLSGLMRIVGKNELETGDATVFEGGVGVTLVAAEGLALTLGGRYVKGSGTNVAGLDRDIKGLEGSFHLILQLPE